MSDTAPKRPWIRRIAVFALIAIGGALLGSFLISRADGPIFIFSGGPLRSGEIVALQDLDWARLDAETALELEIVGSSTSLTLWFSVHDGVPYVACDLDCVGGRLTRWPQLIARDDRVVLRIDGRRAEGRLVHIPHGTPEYAAARAVRHAKYAGDGGPRAAAETAAHAAVVDIGETLTGRDRREEPGDRLYRVDPR